MRIFAQIACVILFFLCTLFASLQPVYAQTPSQSSNNLNGISSNTDANVPQNGDTYAQETLINVVSAFMCQLTGIDSTNPQQPCLGVNPTTGKIGFPPAQSAHTFGQVQTQSQLNGAMGLISGSISSLYTPPISTAQYTDYLSSSFGIVHQADAASNTSSCSNTLGYGFCGLTTIFSLWAGIRDFAYAGLTILFIVIGVGVMLRFRVDPRTVMTLQNQIPRVIIAILLITFSYAIAGVMIDLMWTVTYAGVNFISNTSGAQVVFCQQANHQPHPLSNVVEQQLIEDPFNFTDTVFRGSCGGGVNNGILSLSSDVATALGTIVTQAIETTLNFNESGCGFSLEIFNPAHDIGCAAQSAFGTFLIWTAEQIVKLIVIIALLIALFRLWWKLISSYITFIIFVIMGPLWIVMGLIPGRPLGFEKWFRIIFANLAVFPLEAFLIVFARVITDVPQALNPQNNFVAPLIGNPNVSTFTALLGVGAILMAPSVPDLIKERMKATGQAKYGAAIAAMAVPAVKFATNPATQAWKSANRYDAHGNPEGAIAVRKAQVMQNLPGIGRQFQAKAEQRRIRAHAVYSGESIPTLRKIRQAQKSQGYRVDIYGNRIGGSQMQTSAGTAATQTATTSQPNTSGGSGTTPRGGAGTGPSGGRPGSSGPRR